MEQFKSQGGFCRKGRGAVAPLVLAVALCFSPVVHAGGMAGMATEVTQMMNNTELLFQSVQEAENLLVTINQYTTMLQNLQNLPQQMVQQVLGDNFGSIGEKIAKFQQVAGAVMRLQESSKNLGNVFKNLEGAAGRMNMSPLDYTRMAIGQAKNRNSYFEQQIKNASNTADSVQRDSKALQQVASEIGSSGAGDAGIVRAVGNLTQSSIINAQIASDMKATLAQLSEMEAVKGQASVEEKAVQRANDDAYTNYVRRQY